MPQPGGWPSRSRLRLHHVYYLLAAFDLLTVSLGLFVINRVAGIYADSVAVNQVWAGRLNDYSRLGELATEVNAPGNDVFDSRDVEAEAARLGETKARFDQAAAAIERDLMDNVPAQELRGLLQVFNEIATAMERMVGEARQIFADLRDGRPDTAGEHMAAMDQEFAGVNAILARLGRLVRAIQRSHFDQQIAAAAALRRLEFVIACLIVVMVMGIAFYGHNLARNMKQAQAERDLSEQELKRHRDHLEELVAQRTGQLETTNEQLRVAERLASIGTLAAGLGHDMNNILFPIRCRLDVLESAGLAGSTRTELEGVRRSIDYLQQLADGLRLLALDPDDPAMANGVTCLHDWSHEVRPLLQTALPRGTTLVVELPEDLPPVAVASHRLTQATFNLVVNAGEAMAGGGTVRVWARADDDGGTVRIGVTDDGQGMTPEVRRRALDPFYTTKKRGFSTGLGLALVAGVAKAAGGRVDIESAPDRGTTVVLTMSAAPQAGADTGEPLEAPLAAVSLRDTRMAAVLSALLRSEGFEVCAGDGSPPEDAMLWVTEPASESLDAARRFLERSPRRRLVVYGGIAGEWEAIGATCIGESEGLESMRRTFRRAAAQEATA